MALFYEKNRNNIGSYYQYTVLQEFYLNFKQNNDIVQRLKGNSFLTSNQTENERL